METIIAQTVAFTGHRHYAEECAESLSDTIRTLYAQGFRTFLSGMAIGFDMAAAEAVIALRGELKGLRLECIVPFEGMERRFSSDSRERFRRIIDAADCVEVLAPRYAHNVYFQRNDALYLIAWTLAAVISVSVFIRISAGLAREIFPRLRRCCAVTGAVSAGAALFMLENGLRIGQGADIVTGVLAAVLTGIIPLVLCLCGRKEVAE